MFSGITITAGGFYGPQGRELRLQIADETFKEVLHKFNYYGHRITNFEMVSALVAGLAKLMGHKAVTICSIIAGRMTNKANTNYKGSIEDLIKIVLEKL